MSEYHCTLYYYDQAGNLVKTVSPEGVHPNRNGTWLEEMAGSVILNWLKEHSKRQVQYMAGHKYISSTENYASQEIEGLQDQLTKYHPFG